MKNVLLVVDDDEVMVKLITEICHRRLPEVRLLTAATGQAGLHLARTEKPGVVALDVTLPDINGLEVCRQIRADPATANTHILMITGVRMEAKDRIKGIESGADYYLFKPFDAAEFALLVKALFRWWAAEQRQVEQFQALVTQRTADLAAANAQMEKEISARKAAEQQRQAAVELNEQILASSPIGIVAYEASGQCILANEAAAKIGGGTVAQVLQQNFRQVASWKNYGLLAAADKALSSGQSELLDAHMVTSFGKEVWLAFRWIPFHFHGAQHLLVMVTDITARKSSEVELKQSENKYRQLVETLEEGIWMVDAQQITTYVNPHMAKMLGYTVEEMLGVSPFNFMFEEDAKQARTRVEERRKGQAGRVQTKLRRKDGSVLHISAHVTPLMTPANVFAGTLSAITDLTEQRLMEQKLIHAGKMESIGILAGGIAHDFNNILAAMLGHTELLMQELETRQPAVCARLRIIFNEGQRAAELTRQLLAFSQRQMLVRKTHDLNSIINSMRETLAYVLGASVEVQTHLDPELPPVSVDQNSIRKILVELAQNARQAMPQGGRLHLRTEGVTLTEAETHFLPDARAGNFVRLMVSDSGPGMSAQVLAHLFDPFFSTKQLGAGLGLPSVYGAIKQQEGWIHAFNASGGGATFQLYFPALEARPGKHLATPPPLTATGRGERLLLIEDEASLRRLTKSFLKDNGYQVTDVANAEEAVDIFRREQGRFDLIFSDIVLPGRSGIELVLELRALKPDLCVLLTSGYNDPDTRWPELKQHNLPFIDKTCPLNELMNTLRQLLNAGCPPPAPAGKKE